MASEVEICNRALQKLGARRIVALNENSVNARAVAQAYPIVRDAQLRAHPWNFAVKRAQLAANSTAPLFGKQSAYPLPSDFLRLLPRDPGSGFNQSWSPNIPFNGYIDRDWQIEGTELLTNETGAFDLRYIAFVTDPNKMDILFREAVSAALAIEICEELTQSNAKKADAKDDYKKAIAEARRTNAIENIAVFPPEDTFVVVRA